MTGLSVPSTPPRQAHSATSTPLSPEQQHQIEQNRQAALARREARTAARAQPATPPPQGPSGEKRTPLTPQQEAQIERNRQVALAKLAAKQASPQKAHNSSSSASAVLSPPAGSLQTSSSSTGQSALSSEQLQKIEQNRQRALEKLAEKKRLREQQQQQQAIQSGPDAKRQRTDTDPAPAQHDERPELVCERCGAKDHDGPGGLIDPKCYKAFQIAVCRRCKQDHEEYEYINKVVCLMRRCRTYRSCRTRCRPL